MRFGRGFPVPATVITIGPGVSATPASADATGSVDTATFQVRFFNTSTATGTGVANNPSHGTKATAATGTGTANNATVNFGTTRAPAVAATGTGDTGGMSTRVASKPGTAATTGSAVVPTVKRSNAQTANATVSVADPNTNFPIVRGKATGSNQVGSTNHPITLPSVRSGDLLLVAFSAQSTPISYDSSGLWTKLGQRSYSTTITGAVFWKRATGTDTLTVNTDLSVMSTHISYSIKGARDPIGTVDVGSSSNSDPPALVIV